jgi:HK97 family phage portal protein
MFRNLFEQRAITYQTVFESGDDIVFGNLSDTVINSDSIMSVNAVYSAVSLIADTISTLPLDAYFRRDGARFPFRPRPQWVTRPDISLPREAFYNQVITSLLLDGNAFIRVFSNARGEVVNLTVLNPATVTVQRNSLGRLMFKVLNEDRLLSDEDIVFIPDVMKPGEIRGISRVVALKENFGLGLALERFAQTFFGQGTNLNGVIEYPGVLTQEQAEGLANSFGNRHRGWKRGHKTGVLTGGASFKPTQIDPEKSTLIESRNQSIADVARAFNVPPHLLGLPGFNSYASVEQSMLSWVTHGLRPIVAKIEGGLSPLLSRQPGAEGAFLRFNLDGLVRADLQARTSAYSTMLQAGAMSINEVRSLEDMRPIVDEAADRPRVPLANVNLDAADLKAQRERVLMARDLVLAGYDPAESLAAMGLPPIAHTGLPSVQLQALQNLTEEGQDPKAAYEVD